MKFFRIHSNDSDVESYSTSSCNNRSCTFEEYRSEAPGRLPCLGCRESQRRRDALNLNNYVANQEDSSRQSKQGIVYSRKLAEKRRQEDVKAQDRAESLNDRGAFFNAVKSLSQLDVCGRSDSSSPRSSSFENFDKEFCGHDLDVHTHQQLEDKQTGQRPDGYSTAIGDSERSASPVFKSASFNIHPSPVDVLPRSYAPGRERAFDVPCTAAGSQHRLSRSQARFHSVPGNEDCVPSAGREDGITWAKAYHHRAPRPESVFSELGLGQMIASGFTFNTKPPVDPRMPLGSGIISYPIEPADVANLGRRPDIMNLPSQQSPSFSATRQGNQYVINARSSRSSRRRASIVATSTGPALRDCSGSLRQIPHSLAQNDVIEAVHED